MNTETGNRIFVLGDSRTGTSSLHRFFLALGLKSIHDYKKEAGQTSPDHLHHTENWEQLKLYIDNSGYQAFSDYPTRLFYKELAEAYPNAHFILSTRKDVDTWEHSMVNYFAKFNIKLDMPELRRFHIALNESIRQQFYEQPARFLEICIDDDIGDNSERIKAFLGIDSPVTMGWENKAEDYDNNIYSKRKRLYSTTSAEPISYIEKVCHDSKAMLSEFGWVFLVNDTNNFLYYQYGMTTWTDEDLEKARKVIADRHNALNECQARYYKFIIPEKSIIYEEYLPYVLRGLVSSPDRPAPLLARSGLKNVHYLETYLKDMKSYGLLYFRGDSHTNWLGSYFVYLYIVETLNRTQPFKKRKPIALSLLNPSFAAYNGDLRSQLNEEFVKDLETIWQYVQPPISFENLLQYSLPDKLRKARRVETPAVYERCFTKRETFVYENEDTSLPRAVVFRDSTLDFNLDLISQHFSRTVFVWHEGNVYREVIDHEKPDIVLHVMAERFIHQYCFRTAVNSMPEFKPD